MKHIRFCAYSTCRTDVHGVWTVFLNITFLEKGQWTQQTDLEGDCITSNGVTKHNLLTFRIQQ